MFIIIFIVLFGIIGIIAMVYKGGESIVALSRPSIECPVCGRNIKIVGKTSRCYKCNSVLILHANGQYIKK